MTRLIVAAWKAHAVAPDPRSVSIMPETNAGVAQPGIGHMVIPVIPAARRTAPQPPTAMPSILIRVIDVPRSQKYGVLL
ncbi:hypothetical protein Plo01_44480 [Planobispora longispora]|uniref:Uncharacterized protein n=1 Tax=Planobispora longispora TaxID=28887 RepID=A0A8J3W606_9ACTN|nr:hypothetical protein Plo01_44480 [Planobispora longispora]